MITISLCMIVKNEEDCLDRCLSSVQDIADEIIIADTGSTDRTKEIAARFGARIYDFEWIDDFSAARNFAFGQATQEFILWLDADDVLEAADSARLLALKDQSDFPYDSVTMSYHLTFDEHNRPVHSLKRNRLVRRSRGFRWHGAVHEYLAISGPTFHSDIAVTHRKERAYTDRNLQIYLRRKDQCELFDPRDQYYFGNELLDHGMHREAAEQYEIYLNEGKGWPSDQIAACMKLARCYAALGESDKQMLSLVRTLAYDAPHAEFCCQIGAMFAEKGHLDGAIYWYRQAALMEQRADSMAITDSSASTWLPHVQLTYCYDRIGQREKAKIHHEMAKLHNPTHPSVIYNEAYFNGQTVNQ
ncbi:glycosyltransferase family 2 protein [Paenibacillus sp. YIM B09110]|uniref:glycosyltransferase family 2 protein n=1 Tax=Paenibacillus sp. YIM B09110 TaxID=3126102 RepID=UPI00301E4752